MIKRLWRKGGKVIVPVCLLAAIAGFIFSSDAGNRLAHLNVEELSHYLRSFGAYSFVFGMVAIYVQVMFPIVPFVLVAGANVSVFGLFWGFLINYVMAVLGSYTMFIFARYFGYKRVEKRLSKYAAVKTLNKRMEENGILYVFLGRVLPLLPSTAVSLGAGISKVSAADYIVGTVIGKLPAVLLESFIGHDLLHFRQYKGRLLLLGALFVLLLAAGAALKNKLSSGKTAE